MSSTLSAALFTSCKQKHSRMKTDLPNSPLPAQLESFLVTNCTRGKLRHEYIVADARELDSVDFRSTSDPKKRRKVRKQIVQEIRLPDGEVTFPLVANYKNANRTVPLQPPVGDGQPSGSSNVEPLLLGNADAGKLTFPIPSSR